MPHRQVTSLRPAMQLEGKLTATTIGQDFKDTFESLVSGLEEYPHARLNVSGRKVQTTRMLKASCPVCGYTIRLTSKWANLGLPSCPQDGSIFTI